MQDVYIVIMAVLLTFSTVGIYLLSKTVLNILTLMKPYKSVANADAEDKKYDALVKKNAIAQYYGLNKSIPSDTMVFKTDTTHLTQPGVSVKYTTPRPKNQRKLPIKK